MDNNDRSTKYMESFTNIGVLIALPILIYYSFTRTAHWLILVALGIFIGFRLFGYYYDRKYDKQNKG